jgi:hypothetical protein
MRMQKTVCDDTGKLVESLVLALEFTSPPETPGDIPEDSLEERLIGVRVFDGPGIDFDGDRIAIG